MANEGLPALQYYPWRLFFPALLISQTMLAFHLIGEGLKYAFHLEAPNDAPPA
jgi:oligopeptide transport system permease protein